MSIFVIDNTDFVKILELKEESLNFIREVGVFETVDDAESYANKHNIDIFGEAEDWKID